MDFVHMIRETKGTADFVHPSLHRHAFWQGQETRAQRKNIVLYSFKLIEHGFKWLCQ